MHYSRRDWMRLVSAGLSAAASYPAPRKAEAAAQPNVVFILADDLGYGDLSCLNENSKIRTPNLDQLASQGVTFTDAHSPSSVCTPTRYGVLTGCYCWRSPLKNGVLAGGSPALIAPERMTVASLLKKSGYATACTGKWHLGLNWVTRDGAPVAADMSNVDFRQPYGRGPLTLGFDFYYGISASLDMPPYTYLENDRATVVPDSVTEGGKFPVNWRKGPLARDFRHEEVLSRITAKATAWLRQQTPAKPFFLYMPLSAPHTPVVPRRQFRNLTGAGDYGAFVREVDWSVGEVLKTLQETGAADNTLLVFTSDNGPERQMEDRKKEFGHYSAYHYRGHKRHLWDGGHRVPFLVRWPARVKAGSKNSSLVCLTDLTATCAGILGSRLPRDAAEDSYSLLPALTHAKAPVRDAVVHHSASGAFAIRQGNWKLIELRGTGDGKPSPDTSLPPGQLYDLAADPQESRNLYNDKPDVVRRLRDLLESYRRDGRSAPPA